MLFFNRYIFFSMWSFSFSPFSISLFLGQFDFIHFQCTELYGFQFCL